MFLQLATWIIVILAPDEARLKEISTETRIYIKLYSYFMNPATIIS